MIQFKLKFFVKNYEKVILAIVLIFFVLSLFWLVQLFYSILDEKLSFEVSAGTIKYIPLKKTDYNELYKLEHPTTWNSSVQRETNKSSENYIITFTDFMVPFKMARSNAAGAKKKIIPYDYYQIGICPITKGKLLTKNIVRYSADIDNDLIPDTVEKKYGLNPNDPNDAQGDTDKDTFSNVQDYLYSEKGIADSKVHPPLIKRLVLVSIPDPLIPIRIKNIIKKSKDKNNWDIQIETYNDSNIKTKFFKIGDTFKVNGTNYNISDIDEKKVEQLDPKLGAMVESDISEVILLDNTGQKIVAQINKAVYQQITHAVVKDLYTNKEVPVTMNQTVVMGNEKIGIEKYKLVFIDNNKLEFSDGNKKYYVGFETDYIPPKEK